METCFNYCDDKQAFFSSDERKWITRIRKLHQQNPDEVIILRQPETNDGCIYCKLPAYYLKLQPKKKVTMSEERKAKLRIQLEKARKKTTKLL